MNYKKILGAVFLLMAFTLSAEEKSITIYQSDIDSLYEQMLQQYSSNEIELADVEKEQLLNDIKEHFIQNAIFEKEAADNGVSISESDLDKALSEYVGGISDQEEVKSLLSSFGEDYDSFRENIRKQLLAERYLKTALGNGVSVSDEEVAMYYEENKLHYEIPEQIHVRHIFIGVGEGADPVFHEMALKECNEIKEKLNGGALFSDLAEESSDCPSSTKGGDLGYIAHGQMDSLFETAAFAMNVGEISDVVKTDYGYHIIEVLDKKEKSYLSLDEIRSSIVEMLESIKMQENLPSFMENIKSGYLIEII